MKKYAFFLNLLLALSMLASLAPAQAAPQPGPSSIAQPPAPQDPTERLMQATGGTARISANKATGVARFVSLEPGSVPAFTLKTLTTQAASEQALAFLGAYGGLFGISNPQNELQLADVSTDQFGAVHVEYHQVHQGVPVFAGVLRVHFDAAGQLTAINGVFVPSIKVNTSPTISVEQASAIAIAQVNGNKSQTAWLSTQNVTKPRQSGLSATDITLYIFRANLARGVPGANHLVYEITVTNGLDVREFVYIDAHSGEIVDQITGVYSALYRRAFNGEANYPATPYWVEGDTFPTPNTEANNVLYGTAEIYNLISSITGGAYRAWNGADIGMDGIFNATMDGSCPNAQWTGAYARFCPGVSGDDTVGHEWGHAYTDGTHNLIYQWQSGALNETYSDMWGEIVDFVNNRGTDSPGGLRTDGNCSVYAGGGPDNSYRWLSGEDDPGMGIIRDMWWPHCFNDPDKVSDTRYVCSTGDQGGVHTNCGVPSHSFALLTDGGSFNGQTVAGIGITKTAHLYWRAQYVYQTPTTDFADHADALEQACQDLVGQPLYELSTTVSQTTFSTAVFTTTDCVQVGKAAAAVELRAEPVQCNFEPLLDPTVPPLCAPLEIHDPIYAQDWESGNLGDWTVGTRDVLKPANFILDNWLVTSTLPAGNTGWAVFAEDPLDGSCGSADDQSSVRYLESATMTIPADVTAPKLSFDHWVATEQDYDGGNVKLSVNGGPWQLVPESAFTFNPYPDQLETTGNGNTNPLAGEWAFHGTDGGVLSGTWSRSLIDLSGLVSAGDQIKLRFEMGVDGCNGVLGWYMDDVQLYRCIQAPSGTLQGVVSDSSTSAPIVGAQIQATLEPTQTLYSATSGAGGAYSMPVIVGTYTVTALAFGYVSDAVHPVNVISGSITTQNFALAPLPAAILSGQVTDASTNWPLYALVGIPGYPGGGVWTDPATGQYTASLPSGITYTLTVDAWVAGYLTETRAMNLSGNQVENFALAANTLTCNAPGYGGGGADVIQDGSFEDGTPNPHWDEYGDLGSPLCTTACGGGASHTGDWFAWYGGWGETNVAAVTQTVTIPVGTATLSFWLWIDATPGTDNGVLDVSIDGTTVISFTEADAPSYPSGYAQVTIDVSSYADGGAHELSLVGTEIGTTLMSFFVDDVALVASLPCVAPTGGGLVVGNVYDANTDSGLNGAAVSNDSSHSTTASATLDPAVAEGFYTLFSPAGSHTFTATLAGYTDDTATPTVLVNDTVRQDLSLTAPRVNVAPTALSSTQLADTQVDKPLLLTNTGTEDLDWEVIEFAPGPASMTHSLAQSIAAGNSIACGSGGLHTDNSYLRVFDLSDFGFYASFDVTSIDMGIQSATGGPQPAIVNLYTLDGPLAWGNLTLIGTANTTVANQTQTIINIPVVGSVPAGSTLVVEFFTPNGQPSNYGLWVGSNNQGQTGPSYIAAAACSIADPTDIASIGFPTMHIVMNVHGTTQVAGDIAWISLSTPTSGTLATGISTTVDVTFDSTGMALGNYSGELGVYNNAPYSNLPVIVPVTMQVVSQVVPVTNTAFTWLPITPTVGAVVTFTASATGTPPIVYTWDINGVIKTGIVVTHVFGIADTFSVVLTATNDYGEQAVTHDVTVIPACEPVADTLFTWTPITPTVGAVVTFTASATGTAPIIYTWDFDGVIKAGVLVTHSFATSGTHTVILTATNDCGEQAITHIVTVEAETPPPPKRIYLPLVLRNP